jgi:hypothetical protein
MTMNPLGIETLKALERQGWDALCSSTGGEFYGRLMTPDGLMVLVNGMCMDRDAVVQSLDESPAWDRYELSGERVVPLGPDAASLAYRARATRNGSAPFEALMTSTYTLVDGAPRLALYQQTATTQ